MTEATGPLQGVTVLDLTRVLSGPYCTMMLGDMGARVIKIEHPDRGDDTRAWGPPFVAGESTYFLSVNRNKESVTLDFKRDEGPARTRGAVDDGRRARRELPAGYACAARTRLRHRVATRFPRLVYASLSGYGQTGPRAAEPGYDAVLQGEGGLMSITGPRRWRALSPRRRGRRHCHRNVRRQWHCSGALHEADDESRPARRCRDARLHRRPAHVSGRNRLRDGTVAERMGNRHPSIAPYDTYAAKDGTMVLAVGNDEQWQRFCRVAGLFEAAA